MRRSIWGLFAVVLFVFVASTFFQSSLLKIQSETEQGSAAQNQVKTPTPQPPPRDILIAFYDKQNFINYYGAGYADLEGREKNCPMKNCILTYDESLYSTADAFVFNGPIFMHYYPNVENYPKRRPGQYIALLSGEVDTPKWNLPEVRAEYDIKMSTNFDSEIPLPYGCGTFLMMLNDVNEYKRQISQFAIDHFKVPPPRDVMDNQEVIASAFISNCNSAERNQLLARLMQLVKVHSYGKCANNIDSPTPREHENWEDGKRRTIAKYKFYFAFENEASPYYVTEKIWNAYETGTVPVYWGAAEIGELVPKNSYIAVRDFPSVEALAEHLNRVANDESLYRSYISAANWDLSHLVNSKIHKSCLLSWHCRLCMAVAERKNVAIQT